MKNMLSSLDFYASMSATSDLSQKENWNEYLQSKAEIEYGSALINYGLEQHAKAISDTMHKESLLQEHAIQENTERMAEETRKASARQISAIKSASRAKVNAINALSKHIGCNLKEIADVAKLLNQKQAMANEQMNLTNAKLDNLIELMKIPDSEKERMKHVTLGIKFFVNASKNPELFEDSLEEFKKAEELMKQDYFVLHRIGSIYLYDPIHLNIPLACDYFLRAAKYASADCEGNSAILGNLLTNKVNEKYTDLVSSKKNIQMLAADSFAKAAFAYYIQGNLDEAIINQKKAESLDSSPSYSFVLAKYYIAVGQINQALSKLSKAIEKDASYEPAAMYIVEFINNDKVLSLLQKKDLEANSDLENLLGNISDKALALRVFRTLDSGSYVEKRKLLAKLPKLMELRGLADLADIEYKKIMEKYGIN